MPFGKKRLVIVKSAASCVTVPLKFKFTSSLGVHAEKYHADKQACLNQLVCFHLHFLKIIMKANQLIQACLLVSMILLGVHAETRCKFKLQRYSDTTCGTLYDDQPFFSKWHCRFGFRIQLMLVS
jgi:hypothetical protein